MKPITTFVVFVLSLVLVTSSSADIINVPDDQPTIQAGIDAAFDGDEVVVAPGTYYESIDFNGKAITVRSTGGAVTELTIIDATGVANPGYGSPVVRCDNGEGSDTVLKGFTITGGTGDTESFAGPAGGGMYNFSSSPTVINCTFNGNIANNGGGMWNNDSSPTVTNCTFNGNIANNGGGMWNYNSSPTVTNCTFSENSASGNGGGMHSTGNGSPTVTNCKFTANATGMLGGGGMFVGAGAEAAVINCLFQGNQAGNNGGAIKVGNDSLVHIDNCTIVQNVAVNQGGGVFLGANAESVTVSNSILWNNAPQQIVWDGGLLSVTYSDIQGGWDGIGNINADPQFLIEGVFSPGVGSPCIDAGNNAAVPKEIATDLDGEPRFQNDLDMADTGNGSCPIVDMGSYEFPTTCPADIDCDARVGLTDLLELLASWGPCPGCTASSDGDGDVGVTDLLALLAAWGPCLASD